MQFFSRVTLVFGLIGYITGQTIVKVPLTVDGLEYEISFPNTLTPSAVAGEFCSQNANSLKLVTTDDLKLCVPPIANYLQNALRNMSNNAKAKEVADTEVIMIRVRRLNLSKF